MRSLFRHLFAASVLAAVAAPGTAAEPAKPRPQTIVLRVGVDAAGAVQSARPVDPAALAMLNQAGVGIARQLVFTPATKDGVAVASETNLTLTLALEPREDGQFALKLMRAINGPGVLAMGKYAAPERARENGGLLVVSVDLDAEGKPRIETLRTESAQLRVPSEFTQARYLDTITTSLRGSRFEQDTVAGAVVPSRISAPYMFNGGPAKRKPGENARRGVTRGAADPAGPVLTARSLVAGIELPKIDFLAPAAPAEAADKAVE